MRNADWRFASQASFVEMTRGYLARKLPCTFAAGRIQFLQPKVPTALHHRNSFDLLSEDGEACVADCFIRDAFHTGKRPWRIFPAKIEVTASIERRIDSNCSLADGPPPLGRCRSVQRHERHAQCGCHMHYARIHTHHQTRIRLHAGVMARMIFKFGWEAWSIRGASQAKRGVVPC